MHRIKLKHTLSRENINKKIRLWPYTCTCTVTRTISVGDKQVTEVAIHPDGKEEVLEEEDEFGLIPEEAALFEEQWGLGWTPGQIYPENSEPGLVTNHVL